MNNYLQGLPFNAGQGNSSDCDCPGQAFDPAKFKLYSQRDRLPTFVLRLPPIGDNPDISYAGECLRVFSCDMEEMVANLTQLEVGSKIFKDSASYYVTYDGSRINGLNMECGKCYRIKIMSYWSEPFWITDTPQSKVTIEFTNNSQLGDVPYQPPLNFVNRIIIDGEICGLDAEIFTTKKSEANGKEKISFQRLTERKQLFVYNAPEYIQKLIKAIEMHEKVVITHKNETITPMYKRTTVESSKNGCCDYDLTITLPLRDINMAGGKCDTDTEGVLIEVDIPEDTPDTCAIDDDYVETGETLCLEFGKVPPPIDKPITPVGTPPVGAPCPPLGFVVNSNTLTVSCDNAFVNLGIKYKQKTTSQVADGNCGTTERVDYFDPCNPELATHTVSNIVCEGTSAPPPVGTPPVGTPPPAGNVDGIEMSLYFDDSGSSALKAKVIGSMPITVKVFNASNAELFSTSSGLSNEVQIPDSVLTALGNDKMRVVGTDAIGKSATRTMTKSVRDRNRIVHAFISVPNGDTNNHKNMINQGQNHNPPLTMTAVLFGQLDTDADYNAYKNSTYSSGGSHPFDSVIALAKSKANTNRLKVGIGLCRDSSKLNNGTTITHALGLGDLVMRPDGVTPTAKPWLIGQMILSPASTNARAYAKRQAEAFARHNYAPIMDGTVAFIGLPIGPSGEAEYPTGYHNEQGQDEPGGEVRGDFHQQNVSRFKSRYPQYASVSNQQLYDQFWSGNDLSLAWREHHGFIYAEFEAEVFDHIYSIFPEMKDCQFEQIDVGSDTDYLSPRRHTQNMRRRIRPTTGIMKTNDNPHEGARMDFILDHDSSLAKIYGCVIAAEPSPTNANFADPDVRGQVTRMMQKMYDRGFSMSFYDPTQANVQYFLNTSPLKPALVPKAKQDFATSGSNKIQKRLLRNLSDIFKTGAFDGWEAAWANFKAVNGLTHVDTLSNDDLAPVTATPPPPVGTPPVGTPPVGTPPPSGPIPAANTVMGVYYQQFGSDRVATYNKADKFDIAFNSDGTISDITNGLNTSGSVNTQDGQNVFYTLDYDPLRNENGSAFKFQNAYFIDGIMTFRKFMMNPTKYPTQASFEANRMSGGYNTEGVNQLNGSLAEIIIKITSVTKKGTGLAPNWLQVDRGLNFIDNSPNQDWQAFGNKYLATTWLNAGNTQDQVIAKGCLPNVFLDQPPKAKTWLTFKVEQNRILSAEECYNIGRAYMNLMGKSPRSIYTSEYIENEQGAGSDSFNRTGNVYRGAMDILEENGVSNPLNTGLFGEYGSDNFYGFLSQELFYGNRADYESSLTDKIYKGHGIYGFHANDHDFFVNANLHLNNRNFNAKYYLYNQKYNFSLEFLSLNEKVKLSTMTYGGQNRERSVIIYSTPIIESFTIDANGNKINIEQSRTGEIIPFPNGELLTRLNTQPPIPAGAAFEMGLWGTLICAGAISWDAPGRRAGQNTNMIDWFTDQQVKWRQNGGNFNNYISGQNGAPITSGDGMVNSLWTTATDALVAGRDVIWGIRDRIQNIRYASYTSSRSSFTPTPGTLGNQISGNGVINWEQFTARDIYDQKKATALEMDGAVIFKNEFLSPSLYEDNVTIAGVNLGRVYGGQTAIGLK